MIEYYLSGLLVCGLFGSFWMIRKQAATIAKLKMEKASLEEENKKLAEMRHIDTSDLDSDEQWRLLQENTSSLS